MRQFDRSLRRFNVNELTDKLSGMQLKAVARTLNKIEDLLTTARGAEKSVRGMRGPGFRAEGIRPQEIREALADRESRFVDTLLELPRGPRVQFIKNNPDSAAFQQILARYAADTDCTVQRVVPETAQVGRATGAHRVIETTDAENICSHAMEDWHEAIFEEARDRFGARVDLYRNENPTFVPPKLTFERFEEAYDSLTLMRNVNNNIKAKGWRRPITRRFNDMLDRAESAFRSSFSELSPEDQATFVNNNPDVVKTDPDVVFDLYQMEMRRNFGTTTDADDLTNLTNYHNSMITARNARAALQEVGFEHPRAVGGRDYLKASEARFASRQRRFEAHVERSVERAEAEAEALNCPDTENLDVVDLDAMTAAECDQIQEFTEAAAGMLL